MNFAVLSAFLALVGVVVHAHDDHDHDTQMPLGYVKYPYQAQYYPGDNEGAYTITSLICLVADIARLVTADSIFSGITTFAKLPWVQCLGKDRDTPFDIAFIGAPFVRHSRLLIPGQVDVDHSACSFRTPALLTVRVPGSALRASVRAHVV